MSRFQINTSMLAIAVISYIIPDPNIGIKAILLGVNIGLFIKAIKFNEEN